MAQTTGESTAEATTTEAADELTTAPAPAGIPSAEEAEEEEAGRTCARCQAAIPPGQAFLVTTRSGIMSVGAAPICPACREEIEGRLNAETEDIQLERGILFGVLAAVVCGGLWYLAEYFATSVFLLGPLAFLSSWVTAEVLRWGAGRKRSRQLQFIALGLAVVLILVVEFAIYSTVSKLNTDGVVQPLREAFTFIEFLQGQMRDPVNLLLVLWGLWQAFQSPAPRRLRGVPERR
jgi:hypothetical protein